MVWNTCLFTGKLCIIIGENNKACMLDNDWLYTNTKVLSHTIAAELVKLNHHKKKTVPPTNLYNVVQKETSIFSPSCVGIPQQTETKINITRMTVPMKMKFIHI